MPPQATRAKVVLNGRFLSAPQTGVQRVAANLIQGLDRVLAATAPEDYRGWEVRAPRGPKHPLPLARIGLCDDSRLRGQAWEQLELPMAAGGSALVNLCNAGPLLAPSAVTMIHDAQVYLAPDSYSPAFRRWYRLALPALSARSRLVVTVSEFSRQMLARFGVAPPERIRVVPNGADHMLEVAAEPGILDRLGLSRGGFVFAFGSLQAHKNLGVLLRAFADPRLADLRLVLSGALSPAALLAAFGAAPGRNVLLAGRLADGEIRALLEAAAGLACPSTTEGFGLPPLEAMILGCPAIVAPAGALPEVCGEAALYAPADDVDAWVQAIRTLAAESAGRAERAAAVRAHAAAYSWRRSAERLFDLIREAA
jgi:glycosyltransferase involved in cell wall biosynthesis